MKLLAFVSLLPLSLATAAAAQTGTAQTGTAESRPASSSPAAVISGQRMGTWGFDASGMDRSARPGEDFFRFANGTWARTTQIPADRSSFGAFNALGDLSEARVRRLVEGYRADDGTSVDRAKVAKLYRSFMDEARVNALGAQPLRPLIAEVRQAQTREQLAQLMGRTMGGIGGSFFGASVYDDSRNPDVYALYLRQSGLGLPDRDYYLEERFAPQKARYQQYVAEMLGLAGWEQPEQSAAAIVALETEIARAHWTRAESRNRDRTYNPMTVAELRAQAPGFPWNSFLQAAGIDSERAIVSQNTAFPKLAKIFAEADLGTLRAWQAFHTTDRAAQMLAKPFVDAQFAFRSKFLQGQPEQRERWKRATGFAENAMGEAIGRDYVELYYTPEAQRQMAELVGNLRTAMRGRLQKLSWMSPETKREALAKLETFTVRIGHPDEWRDYSTLDVRAGDLFGNALRANAFDWDRDRKRIGSKVERGEWGMFPQTVNAYYNSTRNEIVFPAAILQPPFFDPKADAAINYGAIGGVIGHEIIHGFDDQGRKSDGRGVLRDWWTPADAAAF